METISSEASPALGGRMDVRTKIVATVGPACEESAMLEQLARAGVDVFRINMAHGSRQFHDQIVTRIRAVSQSIDRPLAILVDLAGPKIRLGELPGGELACEVGAEFTFVRGTETSRAGELSSTYERLIDELDVGDTIMLADGEVGMRVVSKDSDRVRCRVTSAGTIRSRQGVNVPGAALSVPALTAADLDNAHWAADREIDFLGLSFVRSPQEIDQLQQLLQSKGSAAMVVAKIEKREALKNLEAIVTKADAVMVARGDLGVEIDIAQTPVVQKQIIKLCQRYAKPVIVATQMLDSMQRNSRPTRAEVSDIANAILDGADACMLSGETAVGQFPLEAVTMMNRVMASTEDLLVGHEGPNSEPLTCAGVHQITAAVVAGAAKIADEVKARAMVIATHSGATARVKAKHRDRLLTISVSDSEATLRRTCLYWGVMPLRGAPVKDGPALRRFVEDWAKQVGILQSGDRVVFLTGTEMIAAAHNVLVVSEV